jgi:class 3 adenylate cyclase
VSGKNIKRKLTTILAADVVGYSGMMAADEEATLRTLRTYRGVIDELAARHDGRLFNTAGDAVLFEFGSAVEAVRCAIAIQEDLRTRNAQLADDHQMRFRIGVNVGDVMIEGDDLFGDGVNVAARLEGLAEPGGVCISGSTFEQIKNKLSIGFEDIGPQEVKNIPQPVQSFRIVPGPVTVTADAKAAATANGRSAGRGRRAGIGIAVVVLLALGGAAAWQFYPRGPAPLSAFPANFSTDSMASEDIATLMHGMTIQGTAVRDGQPFLIRIEAEGAVKVEKGRSGDLSGTLHRETGKWWAENYRFCMQFTRFAQGRKLCPRIVRAGERLTATRGNGTDLGWSLSK